jgi:hypothetical protein
MDEKSKPLMNGLPLTSQERGDLLPSIKRYALDGYLAAGIGTKEDFEKMWRECFCGDRASNVSPISEE